MPGVKSTQELPDKGNEQNGLVLPVALLDMLGCSTGL